MARKKRLSFLSPIALLGILLCFPSSSAAQDWQPIDPADLTMKDNPAAPGSHAMILYRSLLRDDVNTVQDEYYRIKIFTEDGKKHANIEIPYFRNWYFITNLKARTIKPDGTIVNFEGKPFDKTIVRTSGFRFQAKTFTMPDVQVGSIIEYKFRTNWDPDTLIFSFRWELTEALFTRRAVFTIRPFTAGVFGLRWINVRTPGGVGPTRQKDGSYGMTLENLPPFKEEPFAPPETELKSRTDFFYTTGGSEGPDAFWKREGTEWSTAIETFIGKRKGIEAAVATIVSPDDAPEVKLRKIYARVQQIRNVSYERVKTEKEEKREKLKENKNVEDVWKNGHGGFASINRLFVALVRAAGFDATVVRISERDNYFFNRNLLYANQLNGEVAWVNAGGKEYYLDPGTAFCPFGLLSWENSGVMGIKLNKDGGSFVQTPPPASSSATTQRKASLKLTEDGSLAGKLQVSFTGGEALRRRLDNFEDDDATRRKEIEDEIKQWLPAGSSLQIEEIANWEAGDKPLEVNATIRMPGVVTSTGRRVLMPVGVFQIQTRNPFQTTDRLHPVYFRHPFQAIDDVTIELPAGMDVETLPTPRNTQREFGQFVTRFERTANTIRLQRQFAVEGILFQTQFYPALRGFFDAARAADEEQAILKTSAVAGRE